MQSMALDLSLYNSINTFDFSTLYATIPHSKLKYRLTEVVQLCFIIKEWQTWIEIPCPKKGHNSDSSKMFSETEIIKMLGCLIDNIFVKFG